MVFNVQIRLKKGKMLKYLHVRKKMRSETEVCVNNLHGLVAAAGGLLVLMIVAAACGLTGSASLRSLFYTNNNNHKMRKYSFLIFPLSTLNL